MSNVFTGDILFMIKNNKQWHDWGKKSKITMNVAEVKG